MPHLDRRSFLAASGAAAAASLLRSARAQPIGGSGGDAHRGPAVIASANGLRTVGLAHDRITNGTDPDARGRRGRRHRRGRPRRRHRGLRGPAQRAGRRPARCLGHARADPPRRRRRRDREHRPPREGRAARPPVHRPLPAGGRGRPRVRPGPRLPRGEPAHREGPPSSGCDGSASSPGDDWLDDDQLDWPAESITEPGRGGSRARSSRAGSRPRPPTRSPRAHPLEFFDAPPPGWPGASRSPGARSTARA
jgi:hypothetical protein